MNHVHVLQIRPIGKITVSEKPQELEEQDSCPSSVPTSASSNEGEYTKPLITKTIKREIDNRKFTIETTVRMEKVNKKNKICKGKDDAEQSPKKKKNLC